MKQKQEETFWKPLLSSIDKNECLPFIGRDIHRISTPIDCTESNCPRIDLSEICRKWSRDEGYPLNDTSNLPRVAQFLAIKYDSSMVPKNELAGILSKIQPPDFSLPEYDANPYSVLSELNLPVYVTTNYDHFMEAALISRGREPVTDFCRWNEDLLNDDAYATLSAEINNVSFSFSNTRLSPLSKQGSDYKPTQSRPLVYHLYGDSSIPQSMVLTEKDFFDFVINLHSRQDVTSLKSFILQPLSRSSLLFIGYNLNDKTFRVIFQGLISLQKTNFRPTTLAVHIPPGIDKDKAKLRMDYLKLYTKNFYKVNIHWANVKDFISELDSRWIDYRKDKK